MTPPSSREPALPFLFCPLDPFIDPLFPFFFFSFRSYDALLGCRGEWNEFCLRGILHGGDNDSTGIIGGCWFGACYGFKGVPQIHVEGLEKFDVLVSLGEELYKQAKKDDV